MSGIQKMIDKLVGATFRAHRPRPSTQSAARCYILYHRTSPLVRERKNSPVRLPQKFQFSTPEKAWAHELQQVKVSASLLGEELRLDPALYILVGYVHVEESWFEADWSDTVDPLAFKSEIAQAKWWRGR